MSITRQNDKGKGTRGIGDMDPTLFPIVPDILHAMQDEYPISLVKIQHIIDRVHKRYPLVSKSDVTLVTKTFFECLRSILVAGDSLSISNMFTHMHLYRYNRISKNKFMHIVKVKLSTARKLKQ